MSFSLIKRMSSDLLIAPNNLKYIIRTSPYRYKKYYIAKRGNRGQRLIAQPAKEVKQIQYWVIKNVLSKFDVHSAATAYKEGCSIRDNALIHAGNKCLLKLDFKDFFPSITSQDIGFFLIDSSLGFDEHEIKYLSAILSWSPTRSSEGIVAIGAPSSPMLTNAMLFDFDSKVYKWCEGNNINYTRYADDIALSGNSKKKLFKAKIIITKFLDAMDSPSLVLNKQKTVFAMKPFRRFVTGLYLSNDDKISLGRERKRLIRAQVHYYLNGRLDKDEIESLKGMISFSRSVEPTFVDRLEEKYGKLF
ncbi:retron St85 family RNA-directed DNA polymerase [Maridesulfovibrio sp.]|uniref:retron St85 family RNA-directed DNA polymerase n=1 Tax=Maridesulfovibrio sp. TaxID=2795000 RepID=UPI0029CA0954|nr:retron St85 family RNA-directed DNA polymerase [Maridesulfovibrio sp.]